MGNFWEIYEASKKFRGLSTSSENFWKVSLTEVPRDARNVQEFSTYGKNHKDKRNPRKAWKIRESFQNFREPPRFRSSSIKSRIFRPVQGAFEKVRKLPTSTGKIKSENFRNVQWASKSQRTSEMSRERPRRSRFLSKFQGSSEKFSKLQRSSWNFQRTKIPQNSGKFQKVLETSEKL